MHQAVWNNTATTRDGSSVNQHPGQHRPTHPVAIARKRPPQPQRSRFIARNEDALKTK